MASNYRAVNDKARECSLTPPWLKYNLHMLSTFSWGKIKMNLIFVTKRFKGSTHVCLVYKYFRIIFSLLACRLHAGPDCNNQVNHGINWAYLKKIT